MLAYGLARRQYPAGPGLPAVTSGVAVPWPEASIFYIRRKWEWGVRVRSPSKTCPPWTFRPPRANTRSNMHSDRPQHSADSHPPTAFNCLPCSFFFCALSCTVPSIAPASFCTLEYAIQHLQTLTYFCHRSIQLHAVERRRASLPHTTPQRALRHLSSFTCCLPSNIHSFHHPYMI
jgi:hypothetical protein